MSQLQHFDEAVFGLEERWARCHYLVYFLELFSQQLQAQHLVNVGLGELGEAEHRPHHGPHNGCVGICVAPSLDSAPHDFAEQFGSEVLLGLTILQNQTQVFEGEGVGDFGPSNLFSGIHPGIFSCLFIPTLDGALLYHH